MREVTTSLRDRLERHYIKPGAPLPGGIFLPEVGWNGGNVSVGGCDAIYVGFTSTSGRILVGHELKVSRADWLKELNSPGKADGWADECHQWWLVVSDPEIVKPGELPAGWGLMVPGKSVTRMQVQVQADTKPASHVPSWKAVRSIMARQDTLRAQAIRDSWNKTQREMTLNIEEKVKDRMGAKLVDLEANGADAQLNKQRLDRIQSTLGIRVQWDDGHPDLGYGTRATVPELQDIAEVLQQSRSIKQAIKTLTGPIYARALTDITTQITKLQQMLKALEG